MWAASFAAGGSGESNQRESKGLASGAVPMLASRRPRPIDPERLLRERPFAERLDLARIEPVPGFAHSGTACFVRDRSGRRYKLRACASAGRAHEIQTLLGLAPASFPHVLGRERRYLLLEALDEHRPLDREELLARLEEIGARVASLHAAAERAGLPNPAGQLRAAARARLQSARDLRLLAGAVDPDTRGALADKLRAYRRRFGVPLAVEMDDLHKANFMLRERDGDLRYVDEEGVAVRPRFTGLASLVKTADREEHWHAFRRGYGRVRDASLITPEYTEYVVLLDTLRKVANKLRSGDGLDAERRSKLPAEIEDLRRVAHRATPSLDFGFFRG
jgi:hypothetical protein